MLPKIPWRLPLSLVLTGGLVVLAAGCSADLDRTPEVLLFRAEPAEIEGAGTVTLSWATRNCTALRLEGPDGEVDTSEVMPGQGRLAVVVTRPGTFAFRLVGVGDEGRTTPPAYASVYIRAVLPPEVLSFAADPGVVAVGQETHLRFRTRNTRRVEVRAGDGTVLLHSDSLEEGEMVVTPQASETYTLVARGPGPLEDRAEVTVTVEPAPAVVSFTASPAGPVLEGTDVLLAWETEHATRVRLVDLADGTVLTETTGEPSGSLLVQARASTTYELLAASPLAETSATLSLTVYEAPVVERFVATPEGEVASGSAVTLEWATRGVTTVRITDDTGATILASAPPSGQIEVRPERTTTYHLEGTGPGGVAVDDLTVPVIPVPVVDRFEASPASPVDPGVPVTFTWQTSDAGRVRLLEEGGRVLLDTTSELSGSLTLPVDRDGVFVLEATGRGGTARASVSVETLVAVDEFSAAPSTVQPGQWVNLAWQTRGGVLLEVREGTRVLCQVSLLSAVDAGTCPYQAPATQGTVHLTLEAWSGAGRSASAGVDVVVGDGPVIQALVADPTTITLGEATTLSWTVSNDLAGVVPSLVLSDDGGGTYDLTGIDPNQGSITLTPPVAGPITYHLEATTPGTTPASASVTILVAGPPVIEAFASTPGALDTAAGVTQVDLTWRTSGGASAWLWELDDQGQPLSPALWQSSDAAEIAAGTLVVAPVATTTYRFELWNEAGRSVTRAWEVPVDEAAFLSVSLAPEQVAVGQSATLSWSATTPTTFVEISPPQPYAPGPASGPFLDIQATGTPVTNLVTTDVTGDVWDEGVAVVDLPFVFPFLGTRHTQVVVTTNGYLSFDLTLRDPAASHPATLPDPGAPNGGLIAAFWDDLDGQGGIGALHTASGVDAEGAYFIVQWTHFAIWNLASDLTFQVWLRDDGSVEVRYGAMSSSADPARADGAAALSGIESADGSAGNLLFVDSAAPGGLSDTGRRLSAPPRAGSLALTPQATTDLQLCAVRPPSEERCVTRTLTVTP